MTDRHQIRADRRRAEACLKACEGISTEALEAGIVNEWWKMLMRIQAALKELDQ